MIKHFSKLSKEIGLSGWETKDDTLTISRSGFKKLLQAVLECEDFDEEWYLDSYPDIRRGVESGKLKSAKDHFVKYGYYEGRMPGLTSFNPGKYAELNPDVMKKVGNVPEKTRDEMLRQHFVEFGYKEGRKTEAAT